ncbi:OLC1v1018946C1 [Oldenlandia corymbosa var. corymbosa]|uniref:OLC1v1018946C1 n=1 Tax=Oldenlandia corymbosa var. corymbosa TaxID=529605 RepID=A0AAV1ECY6_OLDCO|nr:OLC1v1018946C1 [Oldenlandia corymbosa var. corymbosa]
MLFCPRARSLLFNSPYGTKWNFQDNDLRLDISFVIRIFKLLKILVLEQIPLHKGLPSEIGQFVQLTFLAVRGDLTEILSSIAKLSNLETFILDPSGDIASLPDSLWDFLKLQFLYMRSSDTWVGASLSTENLDSSSNLNELDGLSGAIIPNCSSMERLMTKFPNIRKLKCKLF